MTNTAEFPPANFTFDYDETTRKAPASISLELVVFSALATAEEAWLYYEALHPFLVEDVSIKVEHTAGAVSGAEFGHFSVTVWNNEFRALEVAEALREVLARINEAG